MVSDMGLFDEFMNMIITAINQTQRLVSMGSAQRDAGNKYCNFFILSLQILF